jgi:RNA polymerase sigma-70 factor (ECF subfamily)
MHAVAEMEELPVAEARQGDPDAWEALFRRYQMPLYVYVHEWVRDEQVALDLVQEVFIRAVRHLGTLREDGRFGSWLFGIAHQQAAQYWRTRTRQQAAMDLLEADAPESPEGPGEWLLRREDEALFLNALDRLPISQRTALVLHFMEDFSLEEISSITGFPVGTVKSRLYYGKQSLRRILEEEQA